MEHRNLIPVEPAGTPMFTILETYWCVCVVRLHEADPIDPFAQAELCGMDREMGIDEESGFFVGFPDGCAQGVSLVLRFRMSLGEAPFVGIRSLQQKSLVGSFFRPLADQNDTCSGDTHPTQVSGIYF